VFHVSLYIPHCLCSCMLLFVLGLVRSCVVLVLLKDILTFVFLNRFVILPINGLCECCPGFYISDSVIVSVVVVEFML
jgi:hypothetical protein